MTAFFDLDGCLSCDRWRREFQKEDSFDSYHEGLYMDEPMNTDVLKRYTGAPEVDVVFITARPEKFREKTELWIKDFLGIAEPAVLMRPPGNTMPSAELKVGSVKTFCGMWEEVAVLFDDREDIVAAYQREGWDGRVLDSYGERKLTVPQILLEMSNTFSARSKVYGPSYLMFGKVMAALYPDGLPHKTENDYNRLGVFVQIISKLCRYSQSKKGHQDSAHDLAVYSAILELLTQEEK